MNKAMCKNGNDTTFKKGDYYDWERLSQNWVAVWDANSERIYFDSEHFHSEFHNIILDETMCSLAESPPTKREFESGACRDTDEGKLDFEGFFSPSVMLAFAEYMNRNRKMADGSVRDSDNWQKGIPKDAYMKSMWRHFFDVWQNHRGISTHDDDITNLCALMFNVMGMLHEKLKENGEQSSK